MLRDDADLIEGGQGAAVRRRTAERAAHLPAPGPQELTYAFWCRGGTDESLANHPQVRIFTPVDIVASPADRGGPGQVG